jgi:hypothetical protein
MKVKWLADDRAVVVPDERQEIDVKHRQVVDLPVDVARDVIAQGLAEMANKPNRASKTSDTATPDDEEQQR